MSLLGFQRALADMVGSPALARAVRAGESGSLDRYELTERERERLETVARQPGMEVNCTLYRTNRLTPIALLLPYSCFLLGERLKALVDEFWSRSKTDLQFGSEIERFAALLREKLESGELPDPFLREVLELEVAANELRFLPRSGEATNGPPGERRLKLNPLVRIVHFRHDPRVLLARLAAMEAPPRDIDEGDYPVVLVAGSDDIETRVIDNELADLLEALDDDEALLLDEADAALLVHERLVTVS